MECLRPLDALFLNPADYQSPKLSVSTHLTPESPLAFVASMEVNDNDWTVRHSIPNAFMASTPHHPLWLLPLSNGMRRLLADKDWGLIDANTDVDTSSSSDANVDTETMTGPVALLSAIESYRSSIIEKHPTSLTDLIHPILRRYADLAPHHHNVVVLEPAVIFPFSWAVEGKNQRGKVYRHCRAALGYAFDPLRCQGTSTCIFADEGHRKLGPRIRDRRADAWFPGVDLVKAYERGARTITYWSHTWDGSSGNRPPDLGLVGS